MMRKQATKSGGARNETARDTAFGQNGVSSGCRQNGKRKMEKFKQGDRSWSFVVGKGREETGEMRNKREGGCSGNVPQTKDDQAAVFISKQLTTQFYNTDPPVNAYLGRTVRVLSQFRLCGYKGRPHFGVCLALATDWRERTTSGRSKNTAASCGRSFFLNADRRRSEQAATAGCTPVTAGQYGKTIRVGMAKQDGKEYENCLACGPIDHTDLRLALARLNCGQALTYACPALEASFASFASFRERKG